MVVRTPVICVAVADHCISMIGYLGIQLPPWYASDRVIICFTNFILNIFVLLIYIAVIAVFIVVPYSCLLYITLLIYLCYQREYLLISPRQ